VTVRTADAARSLPAVLVSARMERKRTPLWQLHKQLGARLIDFGGWDMPVAYPAGTIKEHKAVRESVGLFDVSHMGEAVLRGPRVREAVDQLTSNAVASAPAGKAVYTLLCRPNGGVVDDCIFYKRADDEFFVIVNASNTAKDLEWLRDHTHSLCEIDDQSDATALIAVQGPKAVELVDRLAGGALAGMPGFMFADTQVAGVACMAARTGYTGEDGFELACASNDAVALWTALMENLPPGGLPIGLGARDTLRLESRLPLYGNDLDDDHTPLEAGLGWAVKLDGRDFLGAEALRAQKQRGLTRQLAGFKIDPAQRAIARHGYPVVDRAQPEGGGVIGAVTSGGPGISVPGAIGLAYVPVAKAVAGGELVIDIRGKDVPATVVAGKFYKRP
jgi:aminomethyltransferase